MQQDAKAYCQLLLLSFVTCSFVVAIITIASHCSLRLFEVAKAQELGSELILSSSEGINQKWRKASKEYNLTSMETVRFNGMLQTDSRFELVSISAVPFNYPLVGSMKLCSASGCVDSINQGELWCDKGLMLRLSLEEGQQVTLGKIRLVVKGSVNEAPNLGFDGWSLAPRVFIRYEDVDSMGMIGLGSRIRYYLHLNGPGVDKFVEKVKPLKGSDRLYVPGDLTRQGKLIIQLAQYFKLVGWLGVFMVGWMVRSAVAHLFRSFESTLIILRCLGVPKSLWVSTIATRLLPMVFLSVLVGVLGAFSSAYVVAYWMNGLDSLPSLLGVGVGVFMQVLVWVLLMFIVGSLDVSKRLFKILGYLFVGIFLCVLAGFNQFNIKTVGIVLLGLMVLYALCWLLINMIIWMLRKMYIINRMGYWLTGRLIKNKGFLTLQALSAGTVIGSGMVVGIIGLTLVGKWQLSLPKHTPNFFALNLTQSEVNSASNFLNSYGVNSHWDSVVRSRIKAVNGVSTSLYFSSEILKNEALNRELNITDKGFEGDASSVSSPLIPASIEAGFARRLGLKIGDEITLEAQGKNYTIEIMHTRNVKWDSFKPNYYLVLKKNSLEEFQKKYISSFYVKGEHRKYLNDFIRNYPGVTLIDVGQYIDLAGRWIRYATYFIQGLLALFSGMVILLLIQFNWYQHPQRIQDIKQLYWLGLQWDECIEWYRTDVRWQMRIACLIGIVFAVIVLEVVVSSWFEIGSVLSLWQVAMMLLAAEVVSRFWARLAING